MIKSEEACKSTLLFDMRQRREKGIGLMTKFDFHKVEQTLGEALHCTFIKKIVSGEPISYNRAVNYFGVATPKPNPPDSVIDALAEWQEEVLLAEIAAKQQADQTAGKPQEVALPPPTEAVVQTTPDAAPVEQIPFPEQNVPAVSPLYILRKRLLWFVRQKVANVYLLLGTTKEEIIALRKKETLSSEDLARIEELLKKSADMNARLRKQMGVETDEALIEKEIQRHIRKRFNVNETWYPL